MWLSTGRAYGIPRALPISRKRETIYCRGALFAILCLFQYRQSVGQGTVDHCLRQHRDQQLSSRASVEAIWSTIENDLKLAAADLPVSYDAATGLGRATKGAAVALLGKSYLYQKKWAQAETTLAQLTSAPFTYSLDPSYENLFSSTNQSSPENIFQIMNAKWTDWGIGNQYYVFGGQETWGGKASHSDRAQEYGFKDWFNVYVPTTTVEGISIRQPRPPV